MGKKIAIIFPCLNEEETLLLCLKKTKEVMQKSEYKNDYEIVVCDNNSSDGSVEICKKQHIKYFVEKDRGYGNTLKNGIANLSSKYIVMLDCDMSYEIRDIPKVISELEKGNDFVCGNRFKGKIEQKAMPLSHFIGSRCLSFYANMLFRTKVHDYHCGLRGFDRKKMLDCKLKSSGFEFASEMVIKSKLNKLKTKEFATNLYRDGRNHKPHLRAIRDGFRHLHLINKIIFESSKIVRYFTTFFVSIFAIIAFAFCSSIIPHDAIKENAIKSVKETNEIFKKNTEVTGDRTSYRKYEKYGDIRNYAMAYTIDSSKPITSFIEMNYPIVCDNIRICDTVLERGNNKNVSYSRYWQGQSSFVRFALPFMSAGTLIFFLAVIFTMLFAYTTYKLFKEDKILSVVFVLASLMINIPFAITSIEFIFIMFVMLVSILLVLHSKRHESKNLDIIFLVTGAITCYFDFLTAETLSLTIPLFIYSYLEIKQNGRANLKNIIKMSALWLLGYAGAYAIKWLINYLHFGETFLRKDMLYMMNHTMSSKETHTFLGTLANNLTPVLPFALLPNGVYALIGMIVICLIYCFFENRKYLVLYLTCLVPVLRFFVVRTHSYGLYYFTYRALMPLLMITLLIIACMIKRSVDVNNEKSCDKIKKRKRNGRKSNNH